MKMRDTLISILAVLAVTVPTRCSEIGKDVNFYKDYLRGRSDDAGEEPLEDGRVFYFYRTPLPLHPGLLPALEQEYKKRTGNAFKNHMLSKELWDGPPAPAQNKRSSKTALSLMLQGKHPYFPDVGRFLSLRQVVEGAFRKLALRSPLGTLKTSK